MKNFKKIVSLVLAVCLMASRAIAYRTGERASVPLKI